MGETGWSQTQTSPGKGVRGGACTEVLRHEKTPYLHPTLFFLSSFFSFPLILLFTPTPSFFFSFPLLLPFFLNTPLPPLSSLVPSSPLPPNTLPSLLILLYNIFPPTFPHSSPHFLSAHPHPLLFSLFFPSLLCIKFISLFLLLYFTMCPGWWWR